MLAETKPVAQRALRTSPSRRRICNPRMEWTMPGSCYTQMGSTGDPPVPSGDSPLGIRHVEDSVSFEPRGVASFRPASGRTRQAGGLCHPRSIQASAWRCPFASCGCDNFRLSAPSPASSHRWPSSARGSDPSAARPFQTPNDWRRRAFPPRAPGGCR